MFYKEKKKHSIEWLEKSQVEECPLSFLTVSGSGAGAILVFA